MAFIPDIAFAASHEISSTAFKLFSYYCKKRNRQQKGWSCPSGSVMRDLRLSRDQFFRCKKELFNKGWIALRKDFVVPLMGFDIEEKTLIDMRVESWKNPTKTESLELDKSDFELEKSTSELEKSDCELEKSNSYIKNTSSLHQHNYQVAVNPKSDSQQNPDSPSPKRREAATPQKPKKPPTDHALAMQFLHDTIGAYPDGGGQAKAAKWMLGNGFTLDDIKRYLPEHVRVYEGKDFRASYLTLQKEIGKMQRKNPAPAAPDPDEAAEWEEGERVAREIENSILEKQEADKATARANGRGA